ncbi:phospholipase A2 family protein [Microvirga rosea]|uniref:phospholipase A2 family protein n=1 Tax=Microvirga rosea TaxID=2715425 RepID=UPI001D0A16FE|nr:phospholipase A2 family protein [Microvirga rosea]MCB8822617.1 hypothetical protein [Microvirga rosea]
MSRLLLLPAALGFLLFAAGATSAAPVNAPAAEPPAPLFHGHWCGLGDQNREAPVDALDAACRAHDLCYERLGRNACACDRAFLKSTAGLIKSPRTDESLRSKAATANSLFSATPCVEPQRPRARAAKR